MSVINKMLRDLDASARPQDLATGQRGVTTGTVPVAGRAAVPSALPTSAAGRVPRAMVWGVAAAVALGFVGVGVWYWEARPGVLPSGAPGTANPTPAPLNTVVAARAPVPTAPAVAALPQPTAAAAPAAAVAVPPAPTPLPAPTAPSAVAAAAKPTPSRQAAAPAAPLAAATPVPAPVPAAPSKPEPTALGVSTAKAGPSDVLEDAQRLWDKGERDAAMAGLRERVDAVSATSLPPATLWLWVSELTRMELAAGLGREALQRLVRLEPQLSGNASAWATRGNVAQRLGRHAESAQAYLTALNLRPDEPRWMLGAAVSLAADGRASQAAEWAKRAQARGVMNPEIAAFLRQQGVPMAP